MEALIPQDWKSKKLQDVCRMYSGTTPSRSDAKNFSGKNVWVSSGELKEKYIHSSKELISDEAILNTALSVLQPGTVIIAIYGLEASGIRGTASITAIPCTISQACMAFYDFESSVYNEYFYYWYIFNGPIIGRRYAQGTKQQNLSSKILSSFPICLPPIAEQRKIAEILSAQDRIIELKTKLLEEKKRLKKYLRQMLLSGKRRILGHAEPWKRKRLSDIAQRLTVRNTEQCNNVLTISASDGLISQEAYFKKEVAGKDKSNYFLLLRDDYAYNRSSSSCNPYGAIKRLKKYSTGIVSPLYICFRMNTNLVDVNYVEFAFDSGVLNKELDMVTQEGARNHGLLNIAVEDFFNCRMELPSYDEQVKIAEILQALYYSVTLLEKELEQENLKKKALMQQLLTGKIRVKV